MALSPDTVLHCDDCGMAFEGAGAGLARGRHRVRVHGATPSGSTHGKKKVSQHDASVLRSTDVPQVLNEPFDPFPGLSPADTQTSQDAPSPTPDDVPRGTSSGESEVPPRKPGLIERLRSRRGRGQGGQHQAPVPGERAPKPKRARGRRIALDIDISDIWAFGGRRLEHTAHYPTGRMLQYQAPAAGVIIDRAVAGTLPDRMLFQPIARNRSKYEDVGFLLAGPLLTFSITTTQRQMQSAIDEGNKEVFDNLTGKLQMQREMFVWVLSMMLPRLAAGAKLAREKKAKADAAIADAFPELGDEDPVDMLATMLFTPPTFEETQTNGKPDPTAAEPDRESAVPRGE